MFEFTTVKSHFKPFHNFISEMRKLQWLVLRQFPAPFFASLGTFLFLILMQFLMQTLPKIAGKELPWGIIGEMIMYSMSYMFALAVPMSVLVATLMTFVKLIETRAWMVIRNAGVSMAQVVYPLFLVMVLCAMGMWFFDNEVLPEAMYKTNTVQTAIQDAKPSLALDTGKFYDEIPNYTILARQRTVIGDELRGIHIFDYSKGTNQQATLVAEKGTLRKKDAKKLQLNLEKGELHRYQSTEPTRYEKIQFKQYKTTFDISNLGFKGKNRQGFRGDRTTPSSQMAQQIDSMYAKIALQKNDTQQKIKEITRFQMPNADTKPIQTDTIKAAPTKFEVLKGLSLTQQQSTFSTALQNNQFQSAALDGALKNDEALLNNIANYQVEIYKKRSMAIACIVFLLLGMPLGLRIKRGGLGMVVAISGAVFAIFWTFLVLGEKLADSGYIPPFIAMWSATFLFGALGLYLSYREMYHN